jgi:hypothetical protein
MAASPVAVEDPSAVDVQRGPLLLVAGAVPILDMYPRPAQEKDTRVNYDQFSFNGSRFQVSGEFSNLQALPFTPSFTADNMVPGHAVYVSTPPSPPPEVTLRMDCARISLGVTERSQ